MPQRPAYSSFCHCLALLGGGLKIKNSRDGDLWEGFRLLEEAVGLSHTPPHTRTYPPPHTHTSFTLAPWVWSDSHSFHDVPTQLQSGRASQSWSETSDLDCKKSKHFLDWENGSVNTALAVKGFESLAPTKDLGGYGDPAAVPVFKGQAWGVRVNPCPHPTSLSSHPPLLWVG